MLAINRDQFEVGYSQTLAGLDWSHICRAPAGASELRTSVFQIAPQTSSLRTWTDKKTMTFKQADLIQDESVLLRVIWRCEVNRRNLVSNIERKQVKQYSMGKHHSFLLLWKGKRSGAVKMRGTCELSFCLGGKHTRAALNPPKKCHTMSHSSLTIK